MRKRRAKRDGLFYPDQFTVNLSPFSVRVRESAVLEGVSVSQFIRDAVADRLGVDRPSVKPEIVDTPPVDPLDSSINSLWE